MKTAILTVAAILAGTGWAAAQEDKGKAAEELKRRFERSMKDLEEKFAAERARLEKDFKAAREKLLGKAVEEEKKVEKKLEELPKDLHGVVQKLLSRVEALEKKLDRELPGLREFRWFAPGEFRFEGGRNFKDFEEFMPPRLKEWLPKFQEKMDKFREKKQDKEKDEE